MNITRQDKFESLPSLLPFTFNSWATPELLERVLVRELTNWQSQTFYAIGRIEDQYILILNEVNEPVLLPYFEDAYNFDL